MDRGVQGNDGDGKRIMECKGIMDMGRGPWSAKG